MTFLARIWPIVIAAFALAGIFFLLPQTYWDFEFAHYGAPADAWYSDLNQDNDYFQYKYKVSGETFEAKAPWNDADSDIYLHQAGDRCLGVSYLANAPAHSSYRRNGAYEFYWDRVWLGSLSVIFALCLALYTYRTRLRSRRLTVPSLQM